MSIIKATTDRMTTRYSWPNRVKPSPCIFALLVWVLCPTVIGPELRELLPPSEWISQVPEPDAKQINDLLFTMLDRWNFHDIDGYMEAYWRSPELLVVVDSEQFNGWKELHDSYIHPNRKNLGFMQPLRVEVKLLAKDLAFVLTWSSQSFPTSTQKVAGTTTMNLEKFDVGWKIIASHTTNGGMQPSLPEMR